MHFLHKYLYVTATPTHSVSPNIHDPLPTFRYCSSHKTARMSNIFVGSKTEETTKVKVIIETQSFIYRQEATDLVYIEVCAYLEWVMKFCNHASVSN